MTNSHKNITRLTFNAEHETQPEFLATFTTLGMFARSLKEEERMGGHVPIMLRPKSDTSFSVDFDMESLGMWFMREGDRSAKAARMRAEEYVIRVQQAMMNWDIECKRIERQGDSLH